MSEQDDHELEDELRRLAARHDRVPAELMQAAIDAFAFRDLDAELAELVFDSMLDDDPATLVRSSSGRRLVSFQAAGLTIDIEVTTAGPERTVMGQVIPPQRAAVEIRRREGVSAVDTDDLGRFTSPGLRSGPVSLRVRPAGAGQGPAIVTDWVSI